jgi:hypothetical protein
MNRGPFLVLLMLPCLTAVSHADVSNQELQRWVDNSTLIFQGKIVSLGSNVKGIDPSDNPLTVEIDDVLLKSDIAVQNFGSLKGMKVTVVNPYRTGPKRQPGASAIFFVNPLIYEKNIAVIATVIADDLMVKDRVIEAVETKRKNSATEAEKSADTIVTGVVEKIRLLPDAKVRKLRSLDNGYDLYSEHSPRWREAVIRVQKVTKGHADKKLLVVFPSTEDRAWARSPKFTAGQAGTWLLHGVPHGATQLSSDRARILLAAETFDGARLQAYTALRPEDFRLK